MKKYNMMKNVILGAAVLTIVSCSSTRHGTPGVTDGNAAGGGAGSGSYAEGLGSENGFQPSMSCNVPQTAGFNTQPFYFEYDRSEVHSADMGRIQSLAQSIAAKNSTLKVVGNTDNRGSREYNVALGWRRANAVASSLEQSGVAKQQVSIESNGAEKPIAFGASEEDYQCNRRVDAVFAE